MQKSAFYPYLPEKLFQYYEFKEAFSDTNNNNKTEFTKLWFTLGTGESASTFSVTIRAASDYPNAASRRVKASETERYDITKYEVPYSQTVPEEYKETMNNPVFAVDEFSRDVLLKRIENHKESNDEKYLVTLSIETGEFIMECHYYGANMYDIFPAFGMNPIPDKIPPTGNN